MLDEDRGTPGEPAVSEAEPNSYASVRDEVADVPDPPSEFTYNRADAKGGVSFHLHLAGDGELALHQR